MDTSSPEYMRQCLVREILGWRDRERILRFIELWRRKHGNESAEKLRADLNAAKRSTLTKPER